MSHLTINSPSGNINIQLPDANAIQKNIHLEKELADLGKLVKQLTHQNTQLTKTLKDSEESKSQSQTACAQLQTNNHLLNKQYSRLAKAHENLIIEISQLQNQLDKIAKETAEIINTKQILEQKLIKERELFHERNAEIHKKNTDLAAEVTKKNREITKLGTQLQSTQNELNSIKRNTRPARIAETQQQLADAQQKQHDLHLHNLSLQKQIDDFDATHRRLVANIHQLRQQLDKATTKPKATKKTRKSK